MSLEWLLITKALWEMTICCFWSQITCSPTTMFLSYILSKHIKVRKRITYSIIKFDVRSIWVQNRLRIFNPQTICLRVAMDDFILFFLGILLLHHQITAPGMGIFSEKRMIDLWRLFTTIHTHSRLRVDVWNRITHGQFRLKDHCLSCYWWVTVLCPFFSRSRQVFWFSQNLVLALLFWEPTGMYDWSSVNSFLQPFTRKFQKVTLRSDQQPRLRSILARSLHLT